MPNARFEFALERVSSSDWRVFEKLASEFLVIEFPDIRTMAAPSGDGGRDAEPFVIDSEPTMVFQYSVSADWRTKISSTLTRLATTFPSARHLVYVTSQQIGADADEYRAQLRKQSIALDVRDRSWFVERESSHTQRTYASEEFCIALADPILANRGLLQSASHLTSANGQVALLHLALEQHDGDSDRNITKRCFESLVLASLNQTDAENRKDASQIQTAVKELVPAGAAGQVDALVAGALKRLSSKGGSIKFVRKSNDYHMSFTEVDRLKESTAKFLLEQERLDAELSTAALKTLTSSLSAIELSSTIETLRRVLETVLFRSGEAFAAAIRSGDPFQLDTDVVFQELVSQQVKLPISLDEATSIIISVLDRPSSEVREHLRRVADAYTLFAFLRQTPDVQKVLLQIFSEGEIWLDTSAILPLIGESLIEDPDERSYTLLLRAAIDAGLSLHVTEGVLEEVERHLNRCIAFTHSSNHTWEGRTPFIYSAYILSGRPSAQFLAWQEEIRGTSRPLEDVQLYLHDEFAINVKSLADHADSGSTPLRGAVQDLWSASHDKRRAGGVYATDPATVARLVAHDVECAVGIIQLRKNTPPSPMGFQAWWLTLDSTARRMNEYLKDRLGKDAPRSPVLSPDFLGQLLRLGPLRTAVEKNLKVGFPFITNISRMENIPRELIELADKVRADSADLNERLIRRRVRDALDEVRAKQGPAALGGQRQLEDDVNSRIKNSSQKLF
jgi:hypothetical protein